MNTRMYVSAEGLPQSVVIPEPSPASLVEVFPWTAAVGQPTSIADEFAEFAADALEWAELTLPAAFEIWTEDDPATE
jgi:hypothetical protein